MATVLAPFELRKKLHRVWRGMRERCTYKQHKSYKYYGGRGIRVVEEWDNSFESFFQWALSREYEPGSKLDRVDNDGPYAPWNCRFISHKTQMNNTRMNVFVTAWGETKTLSQWRDDPRCNIEDTHTIVRRIRQGMTAEDAISKSSYFDQCTKIKAFGEVKTVAEWTRDPRCTIPYSALLFRLNAGWPEEESITRPSGDKKGRQRNSQLLTAFGETKTYPGWTKDPRCVVKESCLRMRIHEYGYSPEQAIVTPNKQKPK